MPPLIYAHRGASGLFPENTMESFQGAVRRKANGIELDVQLSSDNKLVVIHDHSLERTTNGSGLVRHYSLRELRQLRADKDSSMRVPKAHIPTLQEVFQTFVDTPLRFIIEMKNFFQDQPHLEELVIEQIRRYQLTGRTIISTFNFDSLLRIKQLDATQTTGLLYVGPLAKPWEIARNYRADQLHVPFDQLTEDLVKQAKEHHFEVLSWTVNTGRQIQRAIDCGVDGLITNYPKRARNLIRNL
ncbi:MULTISPECIES: glycerophosphodiester phosphodiesterase [Brevibacillus]|uniref:Glycerophosphodiester phosphodiesterase n=1 Tax=Brevibacillus brevis TaxID=1393 RepID=A0A2Z4MGJ9_BREBE|nr:MULTISPECIES: glycerophosphodiester phosphodiesterase [Brevibacillus]AWX55533.1 glycerophosphodiester phosphodiesterase [Brevibacillus brevis]NRR20077.1 glycerophosphodiester phosphodiesterase [Brevibacillus sp. MS2.2]RAT95357.1 glycerophosphodiester phosphodiesterase [Brevibacillus sp. Leaf182]